MKKATVTCTTPTERELVMSRMFDAPRELVFQAWTTPELLKRWYGPPGWSLLVCELELRVGGAWRFVTRKPDGREVGQHGIYREVVPPARLVHTEAWEDWNPGEVLVTTTFEEADGATRLTSTMAFPSQEVRDMLLRSGMADGFAGTCDRLEALLQEQGAGKRGQATLPPAAALAPMEK